MCRNDLRTFEVIRKSCVRVVLQLRIKELEDALEQERELRIRVSAETNTCSLRVCVCV